MAQPTTRRGFFTNHFFTGRHTITWLKHFFLLWMHVPVFIALPLSTSIISLLPFVVLAFQFAKRDNYFWAYVCLIFPVLMPLEYNILTTISRGFVQAHLFIPLLYIPFLDPANRKKITLLFIASALCFIANQSSILIVLPVLLYVFSHHFKSFSFYLKSLWMLPFFAIDFLAKYFYKIHPERVMHSFGLKFDGKTFIETIGNTNLFEYLIPFFPGWGFVYPFIFILLAIIALIQHQKKEFIFIFTFIFLLLFSFTIPKVQQIYQNAGIFFTPDRLYLQLPLLLIISTYLLWKKVAISKLNVYALLLGTIAFTICKNHNIQEKVNKIITDTSFPVANNKDMIQRIEKLHSIAEKFDIELIVHSNLDTWNYYLDSYAYIPLTHRYNSNLTKTISVCQVGDRRTWLYDDAKYCKRILLYGMHFNSNLLSENEYFIIYESTAIVLNCKDSISELFSMLNLDYKISEQ